MSSPASSDTQDKSSAGHSPPNGSAALPRDDNKQDKPEASWVAQLSRKAEQDDRVQPWKATVSDQVADRNYLAFAKWDDDPVADKFVNMEESCTCEEKVDGDCGCGCQKDCQQCGPWTFTG